MLDEKHVVKVKVDDNEITLKADFRAFKKLHKVTGNAFEAMQIFRDNAADRINYLPIFIFCMSNEEITIEEIEEKILGMSLSRVEQMYRIIVTLLEVEFIVNEVKEDVVEPKN